MNSTLILNADYTPLTIIPISAITWKEAIKMSFLGSANTVEYYDDWRVHSPSTSLPVPAVMISEKYIKKKHGIRFSRTNLLIRDNFTCQYCEKKLHTWELTIDHVIPRVKGGKTKWDNVTSCCGHCNALKGHKTKMKPIKAPIKPDYYQLIENAKKLPITIPTEKWLKYLDWNEDLVKIANHENLDKN